MSCEKTPIPLVKWLNNNFLCSLKISFLNNVRKSSVYLFSGAESDTELAPVHLLYELASQID